jgi:hypothetical protein
MKLSEFIKHLVKLSTKSQLNPNAVKLINYQGLPELLQHSQTASENPNEYYHPSAEKLGYDAFSINLNDIQKLVTERDINLMKFYEKKMLFGNAEKYNKIPNLFKKYSSPKTEGINELGYGARPAPADYLEFGTWTTEDYNILLKKLDPSLYDKPIVSVKNYSEYCTQIVINPKNGSLSDGTILTDFAYDQVHWFLCNYLPSYHEIFLFFNNHLSENPCFPLMLY